MGSLFSSNKTLTNTFGTTDKNEIHKQISNASVNQIQTHINRITPVNK